MPLGNALHTLNPQNVFHELRNATVIAKVKCAVKKGTRWPRIAAKYGIDRYKLTDNVCQRTSDLFVVNTVTSCTMLLQVAVVSALPASCVDLGLPLWSSAML